MAGELIASFLILHVHYSFIIIIHYYYLPLTWGGCLSARAGQAAAKLHGAALPLWSRSLSGSSLAAYGMKKNVPQSPTVVSTGVSTSAGECCPQLPGAGCRTGKIAPW